MSGVSASPSPTRPEQRDQLLDALRGFALLGILMVNVPTYDGRFFRAPPVVGIERDLLLYLFHDKFWPLFFFLFGVGAARQLERVAPSRYLRRMAVLLGLGVCHLVFIYLADILIKYAVAGSLLLLVRRASDRVLVIMAGAFLVVDVVAVNLAMHAFPFPSLDHWIHTIDTGGYGDVIANNVELALSGPWLAIGILGLMPPLLLGYVAGRRLLLAEASRHLRSFRALLLGGFAIAVAAHAAVAVMPRSSGRLESLARALIDNVANLASTSVYLAGFVLLWQLAVPRRALTVLAPAGRMSLTNYVAQNAVGLLVFYSVGLGLGARATIWDGIAFAFGFWLLQVAYSRAWLRVFAFGPLEWLWRAATYGRWPVLRREAVVQAPSRM